MTNFDQLYSRKNTGSVKWDMMETIYNIPDASNILPMWVADMDFAAPETITNALKKRLELPLYGYSFENKNCSNSIVTWLARRHEWFIQDTDLLYHQGVVPAISTIVETFSAPGDSVLVNSPIYPPFFDIPKKLGRTVTFSPLVETDGSYAFDFENFEQQVKKAEVKIFILCHPHNPAGIAWSEETLKQIDTLCFENDVLVISDEIHSDLMLNGQKHIPFAKASAHKENVIACVAPTKTFNIAGIQAAIIVATDSKKHLKLRNTLAKHNQMGLNTFAITAVEAAFTVESEKWLKQLIVYLNDNIDYVIEAITTAIPSIRIRKPDATYLLWIDIRETGYAEKEIMQKLLDAGLALDPGTKYGANFDGFLRMNIACNRDTIKEAVSRFLQAFYV